MHWSYDLIDQYVIDQQVFWYINTFIYSDFTEASLPGAAWGSPALTRHSTWAVCDVLHLTVPTVTAPCLQSHELL